MNKIRVKQIEDIDSADIYLDNDLKITTKVGEVKDFDAGKNYATISATKTGGEKKTVQEVLQEIFSKDKNPSVTRPSASISIAVDGANVTSDIYKEVGSVIKVKPTVTFNPGTYEFGPATGCSATSYAAKLTDRNVDKQEIIPDGSSLFADYTLLEDSVVTVKGKCSYGQGAVPLTQLGNEAASLAIGAGSTSEVVSKAIRAFRAYFYGVDTATTAVNSAKVRSLKASSSPVSSGKTLNISATASTKRVIIAVPASAGLTLSAIMTSALNAPITSEFVKSTVQVEGANGAKAIDYDVWIYTSNFDGSERIQVTLS